MALGQPAPSWGTVLCSGGGATPPPQPPAVPWPESDSHTAGGRSAREQRTSEPPGRSGPREQGLESRGRWRDMGPASPAGGQARAGQRPRDPRTPGEAASCWPGARAQVLIPEIDLAQTQASSRLTVLTGLRHRWRLLLTGVDVCVPCLWRCGRERGARAVSLLVLVLGQRAPCELARTGTAHPSAQARPFHEAPSPWALLPLGPVQAAGRLPPPDARGVLAQAARRRLCEVGGWGGAAERRHELPRAADTSFSWSVF